MAAPLVVCARAVSPLQASFLSGSLPSRLPANALPRTQLTAPRRGLDTRRRSAKSSRPVECSVEIEQFSADDFSVDRLLGTLGFMNISSYSPPQGQWGGQLGGGGTASGMSIEDLNRMMGTNVGQGGVQIRIYRGRIVRTGSEYGKRVILKAYPGRTSSGGISATDADALSANELVTHFALQDPGEEGEERELSPHVSVLLGGFETASGEKWLVLRDDGFLTAADYARYAAEATAADSVVGNTNLLNVFDRGRPLRQREAFILEVMRGTLRGLDYMHSRGRLHQSLGPASVVLNTVQEVELNNLTPRLRDFAFAVDVSDVSALSGSGSRGFGAIQEAQDNLWRRARGASASTIFERKAFGISDDIYSAGLLVAYMAFLPLCPPGSIDGPSLQRLLETTFQLDVKAAREYCAADERWSKAVAFLDRRDQSGWDLLQAMLDPDYRKRPTAETALRHPFLQ